MSYRKNPITKVLQNAAGATGNGQILDCAGYSAAGLQVTGTFVGTITWEVSNDGGTTWVGILAAPTTTGTGALTATTTGIYVVDVSAIEKLRARVSAYTSGAITVTAFQKE